MYRKIRILTSLMLVALVPMSVASQVSANQRPADEIVNNQNNVTLDGTDVTPQAVTGDATATTTADTVSQADDVKPAANVVAPAVTDTAVSADTQATTDTPQPNVTSSVVQPVKKAAPQLFKTPKHVKNTYKIIRHHRRGWLVVTDQHRTTVGGKPAVTDPNAVKVTEPVATVAKLDTAKADLSQTFSQDMLDTLALGYTHQKFSDLTDTQVAGLQQYLANGNIVIDGAGTKNDNQYFDLTGYQSLQGTTKNLVFANMVTNETFVFDGWTSLQTLQLYNVHTVAADGLIRVLNSPNVNSIQIVNSGQWYYWHPGTPVDAGGITPVDTDNNHEPAVTPVVLNGDDAEPAEVTTNPTAVSVPHVNVTTDTSNALDNSKLQLVTDLTAGNDSKTVVQPKPLEKTGGNADADIANSKTANTTKVTAKSADDKRPALTATQVKKVAPVKKNTKQPVHVVLIKAVKQQVKKLQHAVKVTSQRTGVKISNYWHNYELPTAPVNENSVTATKVTVIASVFGGVEALWFFKKLR